MPVRRSSQRGNPYGTRVFARVHMALAQIPADQSQSEGVAQQGCAYGYETGALTQRPRTHAVVCTDENLRAGLKAVHTGHARQVPCLRILRTSRWVLIESV